MFAFTVEHLNCSHGPVTEHSSVDNAEPSISNHIPLAELVGSHLQLPVRENLHPFRYSVDSAVNVRVRGSEPHQGPSVEAPSPHICKNVHVMLEYHHMLLADLKA